MRYAPTKESQINFISFITVQGKLVLLIIIASSAGKMNQILQILHCDQWSP